MCCSQIVWRHESGDEILSATTSKTVKIPGTRTFETVSVLRLAGAGAGAGARRVVCEVTSSLAPAPLQAAISVVVLRPPRVQLRSAELGIVHS